MGEIDEGEREFPGRQGLGHVRGTKPGALAGCQEPNPIHVPRPESVAGKYPELDEPVDQVDRYPGAPRHVFPAERAH
jgi:hypothetical protein